MVMPFPAVIAALVIVSFVYVYFLPLSEKCQLLPDLPKCVGEIGGEILSEATGLLVPSESSTRYTLHDIQLFRKDYLDIQTVFDELSVRNGWFSSSPAQTTFDVKEGGREVKLFIFVNSARGSLKIYVNGKNVARVRGEGEVKEVSIPIGILKKEGNSLEIVSSNPWLPIYSNKHSIGKVSLREEYTITHNEFTDGFNLKRRVSEVDRALLKFGTDCLSDSNLLVQINKKELIDGKLCEGFERDVSPYLVEGQNNITFFSDGNYVIKDVRVDVAFEQKEWPVYYFNVPQKRLDDLVTLKLTFGDAGEKKLTLIFNDHPPISVETKRAEWSTTITKYLVEGQNSVMIIPVLPEEGLTLSKIELS